MSTRDWVLFVMTLLMGMFCGMYLYYTTFVPAYLNNPVVQDVARNLEPEWTIGVRVYGGCERSQSCPAFSLDEKGRYRYQPEPETPVTNGRVPSSLQSAFTEELTTATLQRLAQPASDAACPSYADGLDYRILVTTPEARYDLNTCGTVLETDDRLITLVRDTLTYLDNPGRTTGAGVSGTGLQGYFEQQLDEFFQYDEAN